MSYISAENGHRNRQLPSQSQLDKVEIRFTNCVITYKLKHIETQASRYRQRKIGKSLGFSFKPLRTVFENNKENMFQNCLFNPSDRSILKEHVENFECPRTIFINCKFLRRDSRVKEKLARFWRKRGGMILKFSQQKGFVEISNDIIRLKDLPSSIEFLIENGKDL